MNYVEVLSYFIYCLSCADHERHLKKIIVSDFDLLTVGFRRTEPFSVRVGNEPKKLISYYSSGQDIDYLSVGSIEEFDFDFSSEDAALVEDFPPPHDDNYLMFKPFYDVKEM